MAIREKVLGGRHPEVAESLDHLAALLRRERREAEASAAEGRARDIRAQHDRENPNR
jgi:hypothetical protein